MNRRWQKEGAGRYTSLKSFSSFCASVLPDLESAAPDKVHLCDVADAYAAYSHLHSKGRSVDVRTARAGFIYFAAQGDDASNAAANAVASAAAALDLASANHSRSEVAEKQPAGDDKASSSGQLELVVPISSKLTGLSLPMLSRLLEPLSYAVHGCTPGQARPTFALLAIVDDDNSVSLLRCFNYVQPPLEGPEADASDGIDDAAQDDAGSGGEG